jgi:hypothetical protein
MPDLFAAAMPDPSVGDDGRVWWLCGDDVTEYGFLYEARRAASAVAAFRKDVAASDAVNYGCSVRDARRMHTVQRPRVLAGPLTTVQAYRYRLATAYTAVLTHWSSDVITVPVEPSDDDIAEAVRRLKDGQAARIHARVLADFQPGGDPA